MIWTPNLPWLNPVKSKAPNPPPHSSKPQKSEPFFMSRLRGPVITRGRQHRRAVDDALQIIKARQAIITHYIDWLPMLEKMEHKRCAGHYLNRQSVKAVHKQGLLERSYIGCDSWYTLTPAGHRLLAILRDATGRPKPAAPTAPPAMSGGAGCYHRGLAPNWS